MLPMRALYSLIPTSSTQRRLFFSQLIAISKLQHLNGTIKSMGSTFRSIHSMVWYSIFLRLWDSHMMAQHFFQTGDGRLFTPGVTQNSGHTMA